MKKVIDAGYYWPGPTRKVPIPKPDGTNRILTIRNLTDRVVSRALCRRMTPLWESVFHPTSYGFRPKRGAWNLLAELVAEMSVEKRYVLAVDDVYHAFDNVDIKRVMRLHKKHITDTELLDLIECVLRGENDDRTVGIDQGDSYSPTALNVLLHHAHDVPLAGLRRQPPGYRYADNLVYLCRSVSEGVRTINRSRKLLAKAALNLKGKDGPPVDLEKNYEAQILGFSISLQNGVPRLGSGGGAMRGLHESLDRALAETDPPRAARLAVQGWITSQGPAFERQSVSTIVDSVLYAAASHGFRELVSRDVLVRCAQVASDRWEVLRKRTEQRVRKRPGKDADPRGGSAAHRRNGPVI